MMGAASWKPLERLSTFAAAEGTGISVPVLSDVLHEGMQVQFSTETIQETLGHVLHIRHFAQYPITIEWRAQDGSKRIAPYHPDEFVTLTIVKEKK